MDRSRARGGVARGALSLVMAFLLAVTLGLPVTAIPTVALAQEGDASVRAADNGGLPSDVDPGQWYLEDVEWVIEQGIMTGYDEYAGELAGLFGVGYGLTRAQLAQLIANWAGADIEGVTADTTGLPDVAAGNQWYTGAVNWCFGNGIMTGYDYETGTIFAPEDPVSREMAVTVFYRLSQRLGIDVSNDGTALAAMPDASSVNDWAQEAMAWAVDRQIITGSIQDDGSVLIEPARAILRQEVAKVVHITDNATGSVIAGAADPTPATATVTGSVSVSGRDLAAGEFAFELRDESGAVVGTAKNAADGTFSFEIEAPEPGEYSYTLVVVESPADATPADDSFPVSVTVTEGALGALTAEVSYPSGAPSFEAAVTLPPIPVDPGTGGGTGGGTDPGTGGEEPEDPDPGTGGEEPGTGGETGGGEEPGTGGEEPGGEEPGTGGEEPEDPEYEPIQVQLVGTVELAGRDVAEGEFEFELSLLDGGVLMTRKNNADGTFKFPMKYTEPGTYTYHATMLQGIDPEITYDETIIEFSVHVEDQGGKLVVTSNGSSAVSFHPVWNEGAGGDSDFHTMTVEFPGRVTVENFAIEAGDFTFQLLDGQNNVVATATNDANGDFVFPVAFTEVGSYVYRAVMVRGDIPGMQYDINSYTLRASAQVDPNGTSLVVWIIDGVTPEPDEPHRFPFKATYIDPSELPTVNENGLVYEIRAATDPNAEYGAGAYIVGIETDEEGPLNVELPAKLGGQPVVAAELGANRIFTLDATACGSTLKSLEAPSNALQQLVLDGCTALESLNVQDNNLKSLDVSGCTGIESLVCSYNFLAQLDLSANKQLKYVDCSSAEVSQLTLPEGGALAQIVCKDNNLTSLDVTGCGALTYLDCARNRITTLGVNMTDNPLLAFLDCRYNDLSAERVSELQPLFDAQTITGACLPQSNVTGGAEGNFTYDVQTIDAGFGVGAYITGFANSYMHHDTKVPATIGGYPVVSVSLSQQGIFTLDVSECMSLRYLDCSNNGISQLNLANNTNLEELWCHGNGLTTLDLSKNVKLEKLGCSQNRLTSLSAAGLDSLTYLACDLNEIDADSQTPADNDQVNALLAWTEQEGHDGQVLPQMRGVTSDGFVYTAGGAYEMMTSVNGYKGESLSVTIPSHIGYAPVGYVTLDGLSLTSLDVSNCTRLISLQCRGNALTKLDVKNNPDLTYLNVSARYAHYGTDNLITKLDLSNNTKLEVLYCDYNPLTELDVSGHTALTRLGCVGTTNTRLAALDVSGCSALEWLECGSNVLTSLDVRGLMRLSHLDCSDNAIRSLNLSGCSSLAELRCGNNDFGQGEGIIHTGLPSLTSLYCGDSGLTSLDLLGCESLEWLDCGGNDIQQLNVAACPVLSYLDCSGNSIRTLDLSGSTRLERLYCSDNELRELDVSKCERLSTVDCSENFISSIKTPGTAVLQTFSCSGNVLAALDANQFPGLVSLSCSRNLLTSLDAKAFFNLTSLDCRYNYITDTTDLETWCASHSGSWATPQRDSAELDALRDFVVEDLLEQDGYVYGKGIVGYKGTATDIVIPRTIDDVPVLSVSLNWSEGALWSKLTSVDLSLCSGLQTLKLDGNAISSINLASCKDLEYLSISGNQLYSSPLPSEWSNPLEKLTYVDVSNNRIATYALEELETWFAEDGHEGVLYPQLEREGHSGSFDNPNPETGGHQYFTYDAWRWALDDSDPMSVVATVTAVERWNEGTDIVLPDALDGYPIVEISLPNCGLTSIDVSRCASTLEKLDVSGNDLTKLSIDGCTALTTLYCQNNSIANTEALEAWLAQSGHSGQVTPQNA